MKKSTPPDYTPGQIMTALVTLGLSIDDDLNRVSASRMAASEIKARSHLPGPSMADGVNDRRLGLLAELFQRINPDVPMWEYSTREARKTASTRLLSDSTIELSYRVNAALDVIRAHYARSAWAALDVHDPLSFAWHPGFDEYAAHYLHSSKASADRIFGPDVVDALVETYPRPRKLMMENGKSYWPRPRSGES